MNDVDGNRYKVIMIGNQLWMAENLRTTKYNDGTPIPLVTDNTAWSNLTSPGYCWYDNNSTNKDTYGALYNWYTVNTGKLCPSGWHVPSDDEWTIMQNYLIANGFNYDGTTYYNKYAKALASTTGWTSSAVTG
ncbi:MAG: FISUMP domain-containing protein, partial [Bacteroidales bacterium]